MPNTTSRSKISSKKPAPRPPAAKTHKNPPQPKLNRFSKISQKISTKIHELRQQQKSKNLSEILKNLHFLLENDPDLSTFVYSDTPLPQNTPRKSGKTLEKIPTNSIDIFVLLDPDPQILDQKFLQKIYEISRYGSAILRYQSQRDPTLTRKLCKNLHRKFQKKSGEKSKKNSQTKFFFPRNFPKILKIRKNAGFQRDGEIHLDEGPTRKRARRLFSARKTLFSDPTRHRDDTIKSRKISQKK